MPKLLFALLVTLAAGDASELSATVLAAGRCSFGDCLKHGWQAGDHDAAKSKSVSCRCAFNDCKKHGADCS